eukprot:Platyproteum_vivax@DN1759_c0_g1_i1.p1
MSFDLFSFCKTCFIPSNQEIVFNDAEVVEPVKEVRQPQNVPKLVKAHSKALTQSTQPNDEVDEATKKRNLRILLLEFCKSAQVGFEVEVDKVPSRFHMSNPHGFSILTIETGEYHTYFFSAVESMEVFECDIEMVIEKERLLITMPSAAAAHDLFICLKLHWVKSRN